MLETYDEEDVIIRQGDNGMHMFVILEGNAELYVNTALPKQPNAMPFDLGEEVRVSHPDHVWIWVESYT